MRVNEKLGIPEGINQEANKLHRKLFKDIDELSLYVVPKVNVENPEYNACVGLLETCLKLVPNPMYRDDLRLRYYADILVPNPEVDYNIMRIALSNAVVKLNNGKPYGPAPVAVKEKKSWKRWIPSFSIA